jgi:ferredoxin
MSPLPSYSVAIEGCVRCAACSTLAPRTFAMNPRGAFIACQPSTREDVVLADAALFNCPVLAIRKRSSHAG